jgi:hypothetical protein
MGILRYDTIEVSGKLALLNIRSTPDFGNTMQWNGMEQNMITDHMTVWNCSVCPNFKVGTARTEQVTLPIFT